MAIGDKLAQVLFRGKDETGAAFSSVQRNVGDLRNALGQLAPQVAAALSVGGVIAFAKSAIDAGDAMFDMSQKTGISVESLSKWKFVAEQSNATLESIQPGLKSLAQNMESAARGSKESGDAFARLGVPVKDGAGNLRQMDAVMLDLADKFSKMPDGAQKSALAVRVFGKAGLEMIPILNQGTAGIAELMATAERMGVVMSTEAAAAADEFNDSLALIRTNVNSLAVEFVNQAAPAISQVAIAMAQAARSGGLFSAVVKGWGEAFKILLFGTDPSQRAKQFQFVQEQQKELADLLEKHEKLRQGNAANPNAFAQEQMRLIENRARELRLTIDAAIQAMKIMEELERKSIVTPDVGVSPTGDLEEDAKRFDKGLTAWQKKMQEMLASRKDLRAIRAQELKDEQELAKLAEDLADEYSEAARKQSEAAQELLFESQQREEQEALRKAEQRTREHAALFESLRTEEEILEEDFAQKRLLLTDYLTEMEFELSLMRENNLLSEEQYQEQLTEVQARYLDSQLRLDRQFSDAKIRLKSAETARLQALWDGARRGELSSIRGLFAEAVPLMQAKSQTLFRIGKNFARAEATVSMYQSIQNALATKPFFPAGLIMGGIALAKGLINLQGINSAEIGGGAAVGTFEASPVTGLPTSQFPIAEPAPSPLQQAGVPAQQPTTVYFTIQSDSGVVSTEWLRDKFAPTWNEAMGDRVNLIVTPAR